MMTPPESINPTPQFIVKNYEPTAQPMYVETTMPFMFVLLEGEITVTSDNNIIHLQPGDTHLVLRHCCYSLSVSRPSKGMIVMHSDHLVRQLSACLDHLATEQPQSCYSGIERLPGCRPMSDLFSNISHVVEDGHANPTLERTWCELIVELLQHYYDPDVIADFLGPMMAGDFAFRRLVLENSLKARDLNELAAICNMSLSTFKRRFKRTFNSSAHAWITARKARYIYTEIISTRKTFVEIAGAFNISSSAYLTAFCKQHFGMTPLEIRRNAFLDRSL